MSLRTLCGFAAWREIPFFILTLLAAPPQSPPPVFVEGARAAGLDFRLSSGTPEKKYIVEANSAGLCLFDYDGDGRVDIYLVNGGLLPDFRASQPSGLRNALFRNLGGRRFRNVTSQAGVGGNGWWGMGCSVSDADNDGKLDLYLTNYGANILYRNRGDGTFEDVTAQAGVDDQRWSTGSAWADFDRDGDLDLFVANYIELDPQNLPEPGSPLYGSMGGARLGCRYLGLPVMCGPRGLKGAGDSFFINQGDGTFQERAAQMGLDDPNGYYGLGAVWADFDANGYPDLYLANDSTPNLLYMNREGRFEEAGLLSGAAFGQQGQDQAGMGVALGDYRNTGRLSIFVTNFSEEYNTLYRNEGEGNFSDVTSASGLMVPSLPYVGWGTFFFDYDNDTRPDLFVANGHVFPQADQLKVPSSAGYRQRDLLFHNLGRGRFEEVGESAGLRAVQSSRGAAFADLDDDGALDVVVNNLDGPPSLLWNRPLAGRHFLRLKLIGRQSNRPAIGARVRLRTAAGWQMQQVQSGGSYLSQSDLRLHFGLGEAQRADRIEILWPSGKRTVLTDVAAGQTLEVREG